MDVKIVDASAWGSIIFKEPEREQIARRLEGARLVAPALLEFEIVNACVTKLRRHPGLRDEILRAFGFRAALAIEFAEVDHANVLVLAEQTGLTRYDASYLWLARHLNAELITLDRQLAAAVRLRAGP